MRPGLALFALVATLPLGCTTGTPAAPRPGAAQAPAAAGVPPAAPELPSRPPSPPPPAPVPPAAPKATPGPAVASPTPAPKASSQSPPHVAPRVDNEERVAREISARLVRAGQVIEQIDPAKLAKEQREMFSGVQDFISKATEALQAKDVPRAQILADKASKLADDLALALKNAK